MSEPRRVSVEIELPAGQDPAKFIASLESWVKRFAGRVVSSYVQLALDEEAALEQGGADLGALADQDKRFGVLETIGKGAGGEIQLTDSMQRLIGRVPFHAVKTNCARYDCGDKVGFLQANIAVGLARPDIAPALRKVLSGVKT